MVWAGLASGAWQRDNAGEVAELLLGLEFTPHVSGQRDGQLPRVSFERSRDPLRSELVPPTWRNRGRGAV